MAPMYSFIVLNVRSPKRVMRAVFFLTLGKNIFPHFFQLLKASCIPWLVASFSIFQASHVTSSRFYIFPSLFLCPLTFIITLPSVWLQFYNLFYKDPSDYIGPTRKSNFLLLKILNLHTIAKSLLPYNVTYLPVPEINTWTHWSQHDIILNVLIGPCFPDP